MVQGTDGFRVKGTNGLVLSRVKMGFGPGYSWILVQMGFGLFRVVQAKNGFRVSKVQMGFDGTGYSKI